MSSPQAQEQGPSLLNENENALTATRPSSSTSATKRRNRKKRKKRNSTASLSSDNGDCHDAKSTDASTSAAPQLLPPPPSVNDTLLRSKLSLKKRLYLKKTARQNPWYDANDLLENGRGLLLALKLFPSPHEQQQQQHEKTAINGLANEELDRLRASLHRVALWRGRSDRGGRLPHAIDMTAGLADILLMDAERNCRDTNNTTTTTNNSETRVASPYQLRNAYSTLLLRSVNGLADTYRHQKKSATLSVSHCCALAGLPLWIVDVRHDASHNELPGLGVCRIGALESLRFWKGHYWDVLDERLWGELKLLPSSSSNEVLQLDGGVGGTPTEEGGMCTQALDCLVRYQKAAMAEAREREQPRNQQRQTGTTKKELRKQQQQSDVSTNNANQDITDGTKVEVETEDMILVPSSNSYKSKSREGKTDDNDKPTSENQSRGANPWSVLDDENSKKKKKKAKIGNDVMAENVNVNVNVATDNAGKTDKAAVANASVTRPAGNDQENDTRPPASSEAPAINVETSRDCAAQFVRTIPIDIAHSSVLRFLVWGSSSREPAVATNDTDCAGGKESNNGPALVTLPSELALPTESIPMEEESDAAFEQLRTMYAPLLICMTNAYPGFVPALFVHLADSILCLDEARRAQLKNNNDNAVGEACDEILDLNQIAYNVQNFSRWMRYILSREYHMHFDRSAAMFALASTHQLQLADEPALQPEASNEDGPEQQPSPPLIDLKKKGRKKWTSAELDYMQSPVEFSSLHEIGLPLNSVCDRLLAHQKDGLGCSTSNGDSKVDSIVDELRQYLENIIGKERVVFMGIYGQDDMEASTELASGQIQSPGNIVLDDAMDEDAPEAKPKASQDMNTNHFSLEDMEAMLGNTDAKDDNEASSTHLPTGNHIMDDSQDSRVLVKPWTLCQNWDACAIGTLPGFPG